ncbi:MAG: hypothetical protein IJ731_09430 [Eubacterium sp.]|nr:hypothetical protein [Eubacterium sp.]
MKSAKKLLTIFLSIVLVTSCLPLSASANVDISDKTETGDFYELSSINEAAPEDNLNRVTLSLTDKLPETEEEGEEQQNGENTDNSAQTEIPDEPETPEINAKTTVLNIDLTCEIPAVEYRIGLSKVGGGFFTLCYVESEDRSSDSITCNGFSKSVDLGEASLEEGYYYIQIARARNEEQKDHSSYGDGGNCYRNALIRVAEDGSASFVDYSLIRAQNDSVHSNPLSLNPEFYTDKTLEDVPFCLHNLVSDSTALNPSSLESEKDSLTPSQLEFIETLARAQTENCENAYEKAKALYSYISANTYYDDYSNTHSAVKTINNPYTNLKKISKGENAFTCCVGYASMMCAALRALGIPTRVVFGIHLSLPKETWLNINTSSQKEDEHYWVEFFDGTRWVVADANMGTSNKWFRSDSESRFEGGNAGEKAQNNFTYFDPSPEQLAVSHCCLGIYSRTLVSAENDAKKLAAFLNQNDSSKTSNAKLLGSNKTYSDESAVESWNQEIFYANYLTGEIEKIDFTNVSALSGEIDFANCKGLKWFSISGNTKLTSLNLSKDSALLSAYASSCGLKKVDATGCSSLTTLNAKYNPLTSAKYTFAGNKTAEISATSGGTFFVGYENGKHTMKAAANTGYYFSGWFDSKGNKLSSAAEYSTSTKSSFTYTAKFVKLATPQKVKVTASSTTAQKISWSKVSGADGYYVYKSTSKNKGFVGTKVAGESKTSVTKTGLSTGKTYYYYVVAYKSTKGAAYTSYSAKSSVVSKQVVPPSPSVKLSTGSKYVTVKFAKISNVTGYEVYRATSSKGKYSRVKTIKQGSASTVSFKNTKLKKGKKYYYKVRAYKTVGSKKIYSLYSAVKSITCK